MSYSELFLGHFEHPRHVGVLDLRDPNVRVVAWRSRDGSESIQYHVLIDQGYVKKVAWKALGNPSTIAACSWVSEWLLERSCEEARALKAELIIIALELPQTRFASALWVEAIVHELLGEKQ